MKYIKILDLKTLFNIALYLFEIRVMSLFVRFGISKNNLNPL